MTPRALLVFAVESAAARAFAALGFKWNSSRLTLDRDRAEMHDIIVIRPDKRSDGDTCQFTTHWSVESSRYATEHKVRWGLEPISTQIAASQDWLLRGWPRSSLGFRLLNSPERIEHEMRELVEASKLVGIPFLNRIKNFEAAADWWIEKGENPTDTCALLLLAGQDGKAEQVLLNAIETVKRSNSSGKRAALEYLAKSYKQYFGDSGA